ncbi:MAG: DUF4003 family protein [bacterium]|nr:DUF4003 family protein [bacterium]
MNDETLLHLQNLLRNRECIKNVFAWDGGAIHLACASIFTAKGQIAEEETLKKCRDLLKQKVGAFSEFRSTARTPIATMMAASDDPEQMLEKGLAVYQLLKKNFWSSTYLPLAAMSIAEMAEPEDYERISLRTRKLYDAMKAEHPWLTSGEDSAFCALMAVSEKSDDVLMRDVEDCYKILKGKFFSSNAVQSLSHVLALCDGSAERKCSQTIELFDLLKKLGYPYGTGYELPTLGILALSGAELNEIVGKMIENDEWLSKQKGFGFFSGITRKQRFMYAGMIAQKEYYKQETMQTAVVNGTISMIVAQEAAMCAAVAASAAAANSSSN